jgi:ABC-type multidrug transport system fused ATPase/permease subunit
MIYWLLFFFLVGTFIMMIKLSAHLTIACLIGAPLILIVAKISGNAHRRISEKVQDLSAEAFEIAEETIQTMRTVRSFGNEDEELKRFENILQQSYKISLIQAALTAAQKWFVEVSDLTIISLSRMIITHQILLIPLVSTTLYEYCYAIIWCKTCT